MGGAAAAARPAAFARGRPDAGRRARPAPGRRCPVRGRVACSPRWRLVDRRERVIRRSGGHLNFARTGHDGPLQIEPVKRHPSKVQQPRNRRALVYPKGRNRRFSVTRLRPTSCRYASRSADVARLAPCPIGHPLLPWRYAPEVASRLASMGAHRNAICSTRPARRSHIFPSTHLSSKRHKGLLLQLRINYIYGFLGAMCADSLLR